MTTRKQLPQTSAKTFAETSLSTIMNDYFPGTSPVPNRWAPYEERNEKGDYINFQQILKGLFPFPIQSPQSHTKLCVTPLVVFFFFFRNFCHLRSNVTTLEWGNL